MELVLSYRAARLYLQAEDQAKYQCTDAEHNVNPAEETHGFMCFPDGHLDMSREQLLDSGVPEDQLPQASQYNPWQLLPKVPTIDPQTGKAHASQPFEEFLKEIPDSYRNTSVREKITQTLAEGGYPCAAKTYESIAEAYDNNGDKGSPKHLSWKGSHDTYYGSRRDGKIMEPTSISYIL